MQVTQEQLYQDHLALLQKCLEAHAEIFPKSPDQLKKAHEIVALAQRPALLLKPEQQLVHTANKTLKVLELEKPTESDLALLEHKDHDRAVEYATSPITQEFIINQSSLKAAFELQRNPNEPVHTRPRLQARFLSPEHKNLGDSLTFAFVDDQGNFYQTPQGEHQFTMSSERHKDIVNNGDLNLSAGDIIFLSGDFFGIPQTPIADINNPYGSANEGVRHRFLKAFDTLSVQSNNKTIDKIKHILNTTYSSNHVLNEYIQQLQLLLTVPKYGQLLYNNLDHFPPWSQQAFEAGHQIAIETALCARKEYDQGNFHKANQLLQQAYQYDLYAQHFLSDNFAAGHIRIGELRTKMRDDFGLIGSALVNDMHNDDGDNGVWARINGKTVKLYGDGHLRDKKEIGARAATQQAMQASITELQNTFKTGASPQKSTVSDYYPEILPPSDKSVQQNAPLFEVHNNQVMYRSPITELNPEKVHYKPLTPLKAFVILIARRLFGLQAEYTPSKGQTQPQSSEYGQAEPPKALQS